MSKIHVLPDESLGGVLREYVEVDRPAKEGDLIVVYDGSDIYADITAGKPYLVHNGGHNYIKFYDDVGDERLWDTPSEDYAVIEPTDIVHIYGKRYRLVNRKAKVGDKIIIVKNLEYRDWFKIGEIAIVEEVDSNGNVFADFNENKRVYDDGKWCVGRNYYYVLEPLHTCENCSVDCVKADDELPKTTDNMLSVDESAIDLLANLARRVTKLERENKELRHQSHNHRLDIEQIYIDVKSLRENIDVLEDSVDTLFHNIEMALDDIVTLDERTQPLLALIKAVKDDG